MTKAIFCSSTVALMKHQFSPIVLFISAKKFDDSNEAFCKHVVQVEPMMALWNGHKHLVGLKSF